MRFSLLRKIKTEYNFTENLFVKARKNKIKESLDLVKLKNAQLTKQDMKRMFMLSEKKRWDKGFGLSREDAVARFFTGENPRQINLSARPSDLQAKRDYPNYAPRFGSSKGKLSTKQIGAQKVVKELKQMLTALFSIGEDAKKRVKTPKMNIERTVSKTIDKL